MEETNSEHHEIQEGDSEYITDDNSYSELQIDLENIINIDITNFESNKDLEEMKYSNIKEYNTDNKDLKGNNSKITIVSMTKKRNPYLNQKLKWRWLK